MRKMFVLAAILVVVSAAAAQAAVFTENFEGDLSTWSPYGATMSGPRYAALTPIAADPENASNNAGQIPSGLFTGPLGNSYVQMEHALGADYGNGYIWSSRIYLPSSGIASNRRTYFQALSYTGSPTAPAVQQIIGIGCNNAAAPNDQTKWQARILYGGTAPNAGWFNLPVDRVAGWHTVAMKFTTGAVEFFIDGTSVATGTRNTAALSSIVVGYGGETVNGGMYYDDISVTAVPEPSSMLALASGLIGMAGFVVRRRK